MHSNLCTTEALRDTGINQYIEFNIPSPYSSTKPMSRTDINTDIRAPPPLVHELPSPKQSRQSVPLSSSYRFLHIWIDIPASALHPYILSVLEVFCMTIPIRDLLWTSQIFVSKKEIFTCRFLASTTSCLLKPSKYRAFLCKMIHLCRN